MNNFYINLKKHPQRLKVTGIYFFDNMFYIIEKFTVIFFRSFKNSPIKTRNFGTL